MSTKRPDRNAKRRTSAKIGSTLRLARKLPVRADRQEAYAVMLGRRAAKLSAGLTAERGSGFSVPTLDEAPWRNGALYRCHMAGIANIASGASQLAADYARSLMHDAGLCSEGCNHD